MPQSFKNLISIPFHLDLAQELLELEEKKELTLVNVGNLNACCFLIDQIIKKMSFRNIFWTSTDESIEQLTLINQAWFGDMVVTIPENFTTQDFYKIIDSMESKKLHLYLFENIETLNSKKLPSQKTLQENSLKITKSEKIKIYEFFESLESMGYLPAEDGTLKSGEFLKKGENLFVYPLNHDQCFQINLDNDKIESIQKKENHSDQYDFLDIYPADINKIDLDSNLLNWIKQDKKNCLITDDFDQPVETSKAIYNINFTTFPKNDSKFFHLNFFSVLPFYTILDFVVEIKERLRKGVFVVIQTKKKEEIENILKEYEIMFTSNPEERTDSSLLLQVTEKDDFLPHSFQNSDKKLIFLTDREIFHFRKSSRNRKNIADMNLDLINSLKIGDFVVHLDHGIAEFEGIFRRSSQEGEREYLKLKYKGTDKLFVPVESAEKVSKFVGNENPKLTHLGGSDWQNLQKKIKAETQVIAQNLLDLYAQRELEKGRKFIADDAFCHEFYNDFPYELTPGQAQAWEDVRIDMEKQKPMDRLVCGDVGFGKTEIAMRAAFKSFRSGFQCAILSPITILAEQHYQSFVKRLKDKDYGVNIALISRFQSPQEQKKILRDLASGLIDILIGTHRIFSDDVKFKNLGLLIIDEEQRFGVKQKEKIKSLRTNIDILTLTATPIPRTLHMGLNKLKDVSTITTPPPGRLPVITEVRKYNLNLIRERILFELKRKGQIYFLHNQVQTIESQCQQLKSLIPEAKYIIAHGQLSPQELEKRINAFKKGEADVLIASTIIENGIDLPNANTLFVNQAEKFGLAQLYQLRGRVGRSRNQAYAYFMYHGQRLEIDAKKRLRAIVEASELGSGFQIAMKDLEIRGAGEILGSNQSGAMKEAGFSHFIRMLHKTIEEIKTGEKSLDIEDEENVTVEIPLSAFIPINFIPNADEKIQVYQELASAENIEHLENIKKDLVQDYGNLPPEVQNLCRVITIKLHLKALNLSGITIFKASHKSYEVRLRMGKKFTPDQLFNFIQNQKHKWIITSDTIKLNLEILPITWYEDILKDIQLIKPPAKKQQTKLPS